MKYSLQYTLVFFHTQSLSKRNVTKEANFNVLKAPPRVDARQQLLSLPARMWVTAAPCALPQLQRKASCSWHTGRLQLRSLPVRQHSFGSGTTHQSSFVHNFNLMQRQTIEMFGSSLSHVDIFVLFIESCTMVKCFQLLKSASESACPPDKYW